MLHFELLGDQPVELSGQQLAKACRLPRAPLFHQAASLHDRFNLGLSNRRHVGALLWHDLHEAVGLKPQECFAHRGPRRSRFAADLRLGKERALAAGQGEHMLL